MQGTQPAAQILTHLGVQRAKRLVQQQDAWLGSQGPRQRDTLLLATGQLGRIAVCQLWQLNHFQQFRYPFVDFLLRGPAPAGQGFQAEGDVLGDRQVLEQGVVLENKTDVSVPNVQVTDIVATKQHPAGIRRFQPGNNP